MMMVQCVANRVNGVSVSGTLRLCPLFLNYATSVRGEDHCVTYIHPSRQKLQWCCTETQWGAQNANFYILLL